MRQWLSAAGRAWASDAVIAGFHDVKLLPEIVPPAVTRPDRHLSNLMNLAVGAGCHPHDHPELA